ncbi:carboxypeptidase-like regulatory domain-containing protein [Sediminibacterium sp.]|uniref:carboxypeptidase-like regulatory domain-containing protein n=1 Tax=Sediminibacterium sp. TaxID=1917865 RepID=UPI002736BFE9|nr:carboxypeptidase-like regulatory domain-containing protein [Sediminibacterium sp.]MDP3392610.1 carboxypeptidase-like regulatory domain-containing protein [Sediminibacterium sp.]MDP3566147.1 carboxypeptidase-like regulatory domain-containing protein [Sediminibacterium sp.]
MMRFIFIWIISLSSIVIHAQKRLTGKIVVEESQVPIASASIFLSNTSVGTISKVDGSFIIDPLPAGRYNLVVAMLGYETYIKEINSNQIPDFLLIALTPKATELQEVIVGNYEKNGWEKWGDLFMDMLIGKTPNSYDCKLLNKNAVKFRYNKKENILSAYADEPLILVNSALGYELSYELINFEYNYKSRIFFYQGHPLFKEKKSKNNRQQIRWASNRAQTYEGSLMHFMRSLFRNNLQNDGFELRKIIKNRTPNTSITLNGQHPMKEVDVLIDIPLTGDSIAFAIDSTTAGLQFKDYLQVVYKQKDMPSAYIRANRNVQIGAPITARLFMPDSNKVVAVLANGSYFFGKDILTMDYWAWSEKLSNLLPLDYRK